MFWGTWLNIDGAYNPRYPAFEIQAESIAEAAEMQANEHTGRVIYQNPAIVILEVEKVKRLVIADQAITPSK